MTKLKKAFIAMAIITLSLTVVGCNSSGGNESSAGQSQETSQQSESTGNSASYKDGIYEGSGKGHGGEVRVSVKIEQGKIAEINVLAHNETEGVGSIAIERLPNEIIEAQSTEVETISGATMTSGAIINAVNSALEQAK